MKTNEDLFSQSDVSSGLNIIITSYFDTMYQSGYFVEAIEKISIGYTLNTDGNYCHFPDMNSYYESDHFEGVEFAMDYPPGEDESVIVSDDVFYKYVRLACDKYLERHPEDADKINNLLSKMPNG